MAKKTIGLNPLEEYLSAPKNPQPEVKVTTEVPKKKAVEKPVEPTMVAPVEADLVESVQAPNEEAAEVPVPVTFNDDVEVDGQGQLAIKGTKVPEVPKERPAKQRITLHISTELVDRIKNAVYWEPGLTVAGFAEDAFSGAIDALEQERGEPFPQRKHHRLRGGRPVS